jgi:hypothetical protein
MEGAMRGIKGRIGWVVVALSLAAVACSLPFSLPNFFGGRDNIGGNSAAYQADVDALKTMTRGMAIPGHLLDASQPRTAEDFDPNQLLLTLDRLRLEPGYTLDYYYHVDGLGAYPLLYVREETAAPFDSETAYDLACYPTDGGEPCEPYRHLVTDGTEEGYFQLVLMLIMGNQFYLDWHAGYNDLEVIASPDRLEELIEEIGADDFGFSLDNGQIRAIRKLDPTPVVDISDSDAVVSVLVFTKWGGFYRYDITFSLPEPYEILDISSEVLVEYDCGVMY